MEKVLFLVFFLNDAIKKRRLSFVIEEIVVTLHQLFQTLNASLCDGELISDLIYSNTTS